MAADHVERLRGQWRRELPDLDTEPMTVLGRAYRLSNLVRPSIEAVFAGFDIDRGEFDVLSTLRRAGAPFKLTPTELYRSLMITSGGLSHRLVRLERAGLVRREKSAEDGRSLLVTLTEKGRERVEQAVRADMANEQRFLEGLSPAKRAALADLLRELLTQVEAAAEAGSGTPAIADPPPPRAARRPSSR
ncbi:MarR family winged helix-turn-helix transcriptional regulator [Phreatobacter sp. AB_2022a]|uniref:MarR family winged helix-turn-helix transcriptional regulator n=1 Tax=Phreatobacter sp. AB_2022a TaxID=3003134 RepID=UPI0022875AD7|nr:MarR family transcriptional regulator [Phreatobacter sp. AB_2022a]MCZ0733596.1 MarR family transcriptional regulator [Phreatobacter sp. AB_2022a]